MTRGVPGPLPPRAGAVTIHASRSVLPVCVSKLTKLQRSSGLCVRERPREVGARLGARGGEGPAPRVPMADGGEETPAAATPSAEDPVGPPVGAEGEGEGEGDAVGHAEVAWDGEASGELEDGEDGAPAEDAEPPPATIGAIFEILPEVRPLPRPARPPAHRPPRPHGRGPEREGRTDGAGADADRLGWGPLPAPIPTSSLPWEVLGRGGPPAPCKPRRKEAEADSPRPFRSARDACRSSATSRTSSSARRWPS